MWLGEDEKKSLEAAKDAAEVRAQLAQEVAALCGVRERLREAEEKERVMGVEVDRLRNEVAEAEKKPEVPPPISVCSVRGKESCLHPL